MAKATLPMSTERTLFPVEPLRTAVLLSSAMTGMAERSRAFIERSFPARTIGLKRSLPGLIAAYD
jgi:hypothetical protein